MVCALTANASGLNSVSLTKKKNKVDGKKKKSYSHFLCNSWGMQSEQFFYAFIARIIETKAETKDKQFQ